MGSRDGAELQMLAALALIVALGVVAGAIVLALSGEPSPPGPVVTPPLAPVANVVPTEGAPPVLPSVEPPGAGAGDAGASAPAVRDAGPATRSEPDAGTDAGLAEGAVLAGYVHDPFRRPVVGARVRVSGKSGTSIRELGVVVAGEDGRFRFAHPEAADIVLEVRASGFRTRILEKIPLTPGETREIEIALEAGNRIAGRVTDDAGEPVPGATVTAVPPAEDESGDQVATTGPEGRFAFEELGEGPYCLYAHKAPYADAEACGQRPGAEVTLRLGRTGAVAGRVVRSLGLSPVTEFTASARRLEDDDGEERSQTIRSATGEFRLDGLPAGRYVVSVAAPGGLFAQRVGVEVRPGETTSGLVFELASGARVSGTVVSSRDGRPIAGATVELLLGGRFEGRKAVTTDSTGRFEFSDVSEGAHRLNVEHGEYKPILLYRVSPQGAERIHLRMEPRAR